jgi:prepilin peptidase CpaA
MHSISSLESMLIIFLAAAVYTDLRDHRIPNMIALSAAVVGLGSHLYLSGSQGAGFALGGLALGMGFLLPFYALGGMGAGDVKLMGAIGTFLGPEQTLLAVAVTLILGALGALALLIAGYGKQRLSTPNTAGVDADCPQSMAGIRPILKTRFPYAMAIASGTLAALFFIST